MEEPTASSSKRDSSQVTSPRGSHTNLKVGVKWMGFESTHGEENSC